MKARGTSCRRSGQVADLALVGKEDGAHHVSAKLYQALSDVDFTIPPGAVTYWVGEAMAHMNYADLPKVPEKTAMTTSMLAAIAAHLARLVKDDPYPPLK
ncbi:MAG TPA: hypothetical protein VIL30_08685 [Ramlibacter sp.]|jgi:hypothetical protein